LKLKGRVALITGGAQGIGRATALAMAREGADVAIGDLNQDRAQGTVAELQRLGVRAAAISVDVGDRASVAGMFQQCVEILGPVDILVNCAGTGAKGRGLEIPEDEWDRVLDVNLRSIFLCCRQAVPGMMERGWGRVVSISSQAAFSGSAIADLPYAASKAGIIGFTRGLARMAASQGVTVNAIAPGLIDTEFPIRGGRRSREEWLASVEKTVPIGRLGTAEEVAELILFLSTDGASYLTGCTIAAAGGSLMY